MLNRRRERIIRGFKYIFVLYWFCSTIVVRGVDAGESSRRLTYVASIYAICLTRDLPRYLFVSSLPYSVSCPSGQTF